MPAFLFSSAFFFFFSSTPSNTNSAYFGMFERYFNLDPAGMMWSVVILSPTLIATTPLIASGNGSAAGGSPMFGPRKTLTESGSLAGGRTMESSIQNSAGTSIDGYGMPRSRGSMIPPVSAAATADSGLARYTFALLVPERPSKFRLLVRMDTASVLGAWPAPMQNPQVASRILAPEEMMSASAPFFAIISSTWREPGAMPKLTSGNTRLPLSIDATIMRSRYEEFVHEPTITWSTLVPASSFTVPMLSGECGLAMSGSTKPRSRSITRSYFAS